MDVTKLKTAARLLEKKPDLQKELLKIAQDLQGVNPDMGMNQDTGNTIPNQPTDPTQSLNPDIKNFGHSPEAEAIDNTENHTVCFTVSVPKGAMDETTLMKNLAPIVQKMQEDNGISITGYKFTRNS